MIALVIWAIGVAAIWITLVIIKKLEGWNQQH
jgi:hypothetical protein